MDDLADFYRKVWAQGGPGTKVRLKVLQKTSIAERVVKSIDRTLYLRTKPTY